MCIFRDVNTSACIKQSFGLYICHCIEYIPSLDREINVTKIPVVFVSSDGISQLINQ